MRDTAMNKKTIDTLFEQIKDVRIIGERLSGEPEILHEIEDYFRQVEFFPIIRDQIKRILEYAPHVFPEHWKSPDAHDKLSPEQKKAYVDIAKSGLCGCPGPIIQRVIELGLEYRARKNTA